MEAVTNISEFFVNNEIPQTIQYERIRDTSLSRLTVDMTAHLYIEKNGRKYSIYNIKVTSDISTKTANIKILSVTYEDNTVQYDFDPFLNNMFMFLTGD